MNKIEFHTAYLSEIAYLKESEIKRILPQIGFRFVKFFNFDDMEGFICECNEGQVVVFRGSEKEIKDWKRNFDINLIDTDIGKVSEGYFKILDKNFLELRCMISDKNVYCTGHSLGAAMAIIFSKMLDQRCEFDTNCFAFEPPRITDTHKFHEKTVYTINSADIVPRFPLALMDRRHTGTLIYFNKKGIAKKGSRFIKRLMDFITDIDDVVSDHDIKKVNQLWMNNCTRIDKMIK